MQEFNKDIRVKKLEIENRILKKKLERSIENRIAIEELLETHTIALRKRNEELEEKSRQLKKLNKLNMFSARHDYLTNLPNRLYFNEEMKRISNDAETEIHTYSIIFIDLNGFKKINDTLGHDAGDTVLKSVAEKLKKCAGDTDIVSRFGGDEFVIMVKEYKTKDVIQRICDHILQLLTVPVLIADRECIVGASMGVSFYPDDGTDFDDLLNKADDAMYEFKQTGKDGYMFMRT